MKRKLAAFLVLGGLAVAEAAVAKSPVLNDPVIEIWKSRREMVLRDGDRKIRTFRVALGLEPRFRKEIQGDLRTPVGKYYIAEKRTQTRFHRFLGLSYPNDADADRGYRSNLIDAEEWADIFLAHAREEVPPWNTPLGGRVGIHGYAGRPVLDFDWTEGCIAVTDPEIEYLYNRVPVGTPVLIHP